MVRYLGITVMSDWLASFAFLIRALPTQLGLVQSDKHYIEHWAL